MIPKQLQNNFLEKKKEVLEKLYVEFPGTEVLNLPSSGRKEPPEGFPILEVSERTPDGDKPWLPYPEGLKKYYLQGITLRRILPPEIDFDCDDANTEEIIEMLKKLGIGFEWWSTTPEKPYEHAHIRFRVAGLEKLPPKVRTAIKRRIIFSFMDSKGKTPDPVSMYPCRMVSVEWSRHHKRDEYLQLIERVEGVEMAATAEFVKEAEKEAEEIKDFTGKTHPSVRVKWECPIIENVLKFGNKGKSGTHRFTLILSAWLNNQGKTCEEAQKILYEWNEKNTKREPEPQIKNQAETIYKSGTTYISCEYMKRQGFCNEKNCKFQKKNLASFRQLLEAPILWEKKEEKKSKLGFGIRNYMDYVARAAEYMKDQPIYYDMSKNFWFWEKESKNWKRIDETEILLNIYKELEEIGVTNSKMKNEILTSFQIAGRSLRPEKIEKSWLQFKDKVVDTTTNVEFEPVPKYFFTNQIPWKMGASEETPMIDELFESWVGEENKQLLYEICAYCMLPDYPFHRIFILIGSGRNGKGTFIKIVTKFVGKENCTSGDLKKIITSRFEAAKLYRKLVCLIGEIDFNILRNTAMLKQLTGDDLISGEFKNKDPFDFINYAKMIIATNSLPETTDKTEGFYRRPIIIDFPNKFPDGKDITLEVPDWEYENLARKCVRILKELFECGHFHREGDVELKRQRYEERSNPLEKFIEENFEKNPNSRVLYSDFFNDFTDYLKDREARLQNKTEVSKKLTECGFLIKTMKTGKAKNASTAKFIYGFGNMVKPEGPPNRQKEARFSGFSGFNPVSLHSYIYELNTNRVKTVKPVKPEVLDTPSPPNLEPLSFDSAINKGLDGSSPINSSIQGIEALMAAKNPLLAELHEKAEQKRDLSFKMSVSVPTPCEFCGKSALQIVCNAGKKHPVCLDCGLEKYPNLEW